MALASISKPLILSGLFLFSALIYFFLEPGDVNAFIPPPPLIKEFSVTPNRIPLSDKVIIEWEFAPGAEIETCYLYFYLINQQLPAVVRLDTPGPPFMKEKKLNEIGKWGIGFCCITKLGSTTCHRAVFVTVHEPPVADDFFFADPEEIYLDNSTTLRWDFPDEVDLCQYDGVLHNGNRVDFPEWSWDPGYTIDPKGERDVNPTEIGTWTFKIFCVDVDHPDPAVYWADTARVEVKDPDAVNNNGVNNNDVNNNGRRMNGNGNVCTRPLVPCGPGRPVEHCQFCHIFVLLSNIIEFVLICLVAPIAIIILVIGGLLLIMSGGSPELHKRAKAILISVIIGLVIIYGAWLFISAFLSMIGVADWTGLEQWFEIPCPVNGATNNNATILPLA